MMQVDLLAIALAAPGLPDWDSARPVLRGDRRWEPSELHAAPPAMLPAAERRRTSPFIRLALDVAGAAVLDWGGDAGALPVVFMSHGGDLGIVDALCQALCLPQRPVSPARFHNSVHNAVVGYWAIGARSRQAMTALSAGPDGFLMGLVETAAQVAASGQPVMYLCAEYPGTGPLAGQGDVRGPAALAMILGPGGGRTLTLGIAGEDDEPTPVPPELRPLARLNPATRSVSLLRVLAGPDPGEVIMAAGSGVPWRIRVAGR